MPLQTRKKWAGHASNALAASFVVLALSAPVLAGGKTVDFRKKDGCVGWNFGTTEYNSGRGRKFVDEDAVLSSPSFDRSITSASIIVSFTQSVSNAPAINVWAGSNGDDLLKVASLTNRTVNAYTTNVIAFAAEDDVHVLKFTSSRNGNARVNPFVVSVAVRWTGGPPDVPMDLQAGNVSSNSFRASWKAVDDAEGYVVRIWKGVPRPMSAEVVLAETFDGLTNIPESNNTDWSDNMSALPLDLRGWTGGVVRHAFGCGDTIQFGTSSRSGFLLSPAIPAATGMTLVVEGFFPDRATGTMGVDLVCGSETNHVDDVAFNKSLQTLAVALPELSADSHLLFSSPESGSDRRVRLDSVLVVSNYVAAGVAEVDVPDWSGLVVNSPCIDVTGLSTGVYTCAVQAYSGTMQSGWSESISVVLKDETLNMISFTGKRNCSYSNDWDWMGEDDRTCEYGILCCGILLSTANASWVNTCDAVTSGYIYSRGGFYSAAMSETSDRALVLRATGDYACAMSVTMINRGGFPIKSFEISYLGVQAFDGDENATPRRLEAAWCSTSGKCPDPLSSEGWTAAPTLDFVELSSTKAGPVFLTQQVDGAIEPDGEIPQGGVFSFRLLMAKGVKAPALGIDNLQINAVYDTGDATRIIIR